MLLIATLKLATRRRDVHGNNTEKAEEITAVSGPMFAKTRSVERKERLALSLAPSFSELQNPSALGSTEAREENKSNVASGSRDVLERNAESPRRDAVSPRTTSMSNSDVDANGERLVNSRKEDSAAELALFAELVTNAMQNPRNVVSRDQSSDVTKK